MADSERPDGRCYMSSTKNTRSPNRAAGRKSTYLTAAIALFLVVLGSPSLILLTGGYSDSELVRLSNIGQAYGSISAVLSALALIAIGASIAYQVRQERAQRIDALNRVFSGHLELLMQDIEAYGPCVIDPAEFDSPKQMRQYFFTSMWLNNLRTMYELGAYTEAHLRNEPIKDMTRSPLAREFWNKRRSYILAQEGKLSTFHKIVDEEFRAAESVEISGTESGQ